jgi:hypothetical protein
LLEDAWTPTAAKRGRPKMNWARKCVSVASKFYLDWKEINQHRGISDWGHSDEMKDEACRVALELYGDKAPPHMRRAEGSIGFEKLRELIERPRSRRS